MTSPSVGRIVHYVSHGTPRRVDGTQAFASQCRAAIVTEVAHEVLEVRNGTGAVVGSKVGKATVGLAVMNLTGMFFHPIAAGGADFDPGEPDPDQHADHEALCGGRTYDGGTWHWPARADEDTAQAAARGARTLDRR